jgi:hypothetical protein
MKPEKIKEIIIEYNDNALFINGIDGDKNAFDEALIGIGCRCGMHDVAAYDMDKVISILINKYEMDYEEASEWYEFNIVGSYAGKDTPLFINNFRNSHV